MKGTYFLGNGEFEVRDMEFAPLKAGEVLLKVAACGVCGTDVHIYHGDKGSAEVVPPVVLGHELSGVVVQTGPDVDLVAVSDHVAVDPNIYCGSCRSCRMGHKQTCSHLTAIGVNRDGGFAEYCVVPQSQCFRIKPEIPLEYAAMAEPVSCCIHGIDRIGICPGSAVCVIGGGAIGLIMVQLARLAGAASVVMSEPNPIRRKIALELGADAAVDPVHEDLAVRYQELTGICGADYVIECVGNTTAVAQAFRAAGDCGTVLLFSVPRAGTFHQLSLDDIFHKELTVTGSLINPDTFDRAAALINEGRIDFKPIITHAFPIGQLKEAIRMQMSDESVKVIVKPELEVPVRIR